MRSLFTLLLLGCIYTTTFAQDDTISPPNYDKIEKLAADKAGKFYYPKLLSRYKRNDTTLSFDEMAILYYGVFFNEPKGPSIFEDRHYKDSIDAIYNKEKISDADKKLLIRYYLADHNEDCFNLRTIISLYELYKKLKDPASNYYYYKLNSIADVILSTGDGRKARSGFHVNAVSDEYEILYIMGFESNGKQTLVDMCDYLEVNENKYKVKGVYFDVSQMLEMDNKKFGNEDPKVPATDVKKAEKKPVKK